MSTATTEKPNAAKPAASPKKKAAAAAPAGPTGVQLAADFEKAAKARFGKMSKTQKQNYFSLNTAGVPIYVTPSKGHVRISFSTPVGDAAGIAEVLDLVAGIVEFQKKTGLK